MGGAFLPLRASPTELPLPLPLTLLLPLTLAEEIPRWLVVITCDSFGYLPRLGNVRREQRSYFKSAVGV